MASQHQDGKHTFVLAEFSSIVCTILFQSRITFQDEYKQKIILCMFFFAIFKAPLYFGTEFFGTEYFGTEYFGTEYFGTEYFGNWTFGTEYFGTWTFGTEYFGTQCKLALKSNYSLNSHKGFLIITCISSYSFYTQFYGPVLCIPEEYHMDSHK